MLKFYLFWLSESIINTADICDHFTYYQTSVLLGNLRA